MTPPPSDAHPRVDPPPDVSLNSCIYDGEVAGLARSHPYTHAAGNEAFRYLDLRASPDLIRTALEDFAPWSGHAAVEIFYALLERINGRGSTLESNDCAFCPPESDVEAPPDRSVGCSGRVMVLFRDLPRNRSERAWATLTNGLHSALSAADPTFELGMVGTAMVPVYFRALPAGAQEGQQLMLAFWTWGNTEAACMANLARLMTNLSRALAAVSPGRGE